MNAQPGMNKWRFLVLAIAIVAFTSQGAQALIRGGEGNTPIDDPGWPKGAAAVFNSPARIAWWEGPPFGGGQWQAEYRGDAKALNAVLADFAKIDVTNKRIVLHDGVGHSFWVNPNREPGKRDAARMDWSFMVWQPENWKRLRRLPADLNPTDRADNGPPSQIDIYMGGAIKWADVKVPEGLTIIDQRLEAHGFKATDGVVLEGKITDLATKKPIAGKARLEQLQPQKNAYKTVAEARADADGRWVLKNAPTGSHRVVVEAEGYVSRVAGYAQFDDQPRWHSYSRCGLARPAVVAGKVSFDGQPLADVTVRIADVVAGADERYESAQVPTIKTEADGTFQAKHLPVGKATIRIYKPGYCRPGLGVPIAMPNENIELKMIKSARVVVTVDFTANPRAGGFIVRMEPEGGDAVGKFGGSGNINDKNQYTIENIPPGRYTFTGQPNPGSTKQQTEAVTVELKGGETTEVKLIAK